MDLLRCYTIMEVIGKLDLLKFQMENQTIVLLENKQLQCFDINFGKYLNN
jgi:hypothetical protein